MKLVTFVGPDAAAPRVGALVQNDLAILDLHAAHVGVDATPFPAFDSMLDLIKAGNPALARARELVAEHDEKDLVPIAASRLLAPLPVPEQIRDCMCFRQHLINTADTYNTLIGATDYSAMHKEMFALFPSRPFWYKSNRFSVSGHEQVITWPSYSQIIDYEHELAAVIGTGGRDISAQDAPNHIFGYTIFNDLSARDMQGAEMAMFGPTKSKDFDGGNIFGPCILTADAFDPYTASMTVRVNGEVRNVGNGSEMDYSFADVISAISQHETLHPGEIICSGTVGGGSGLDINRFLESGDEIELETDGIGVLRNRVLAPGGTASQSDLRKMVDPKEATSG